MDKQDEKLLQQFFSEAAQQTIEDNGFTERVMNRLPVRMKRYTRIWTGCCILFAALLFTLFHGWELLLVQLEVSWLHSSCCSSVNVLTYSSVRTSFSFR